MYVYKHMYRSPDLSFKNRAELYFIIEVNSISIIVHNLVLVSLAKKLC